MKSAQEKKEREEWPVYFMKLAIQASTRSTCNRLHVGAIIVKNKRVIATGYNGSPIGQPHCYDDNHLYRDGYSGCQRTIHAEMNAILQAARQGSSVEGSEIYVTTFPCFNCMKHIIQAGIKKVYYYQDFYRGGGIQEAKTAFGFTNIEKIEINKDWIEKVATEHFYPKQKKE